jgi:hypothetical protein
MQGTFSKGMTTVQFLLSEPRIVLEFDEFVRYRRCVLITVEDWHRASALLSFTEHPCKIRLHVGRHFVNNKMAFDLLHRPYRDVDHSLLTA